MYLHFKAIADAVDLPIIIYNIPPRSVVDMSVETMARLAKHTNIIGVKDATANLARPLHTRRACGDGFLPAFGRGSHRAGFHCGRRRGLHQRDCERRASVVQRRCRRRGRRAGEDAMEIQNRLLPLHDALFCRDQSGAGEVRRVAAGQDVGTLPPAAGADHGSDAGERARGDDRGRAAELRHRRRSTIEGRPARR